MTDAFRFDTPSDPRGLLILAHGSGQPMVSPFLDAVAAAIASNDQWPVEVARFNFPYMARAIAEGRKRPPDRTEALERSWLDAIDALRGRRAGPLFIGGKSLGGRIATHVADDARVDGVICLGYPFHPPGKPDRLRTAHLGDIQTPVLILQGERDPFGRAGEVESYVLSDRVRVAWLADGDHGLKPRKSSGATFEQNIQSAARMATEFMMGLSVKRS